MTKDGSTAYVALGRANRVAKVDVESRQVLDYAVVGDRPWGLRMTDDESILYVTNGLSDDVTVIDTADFMPVTSIPVGRVPYTVLIDDKVGGERDG